MTDLDGMFYNGDATVFFEADGPVFLLDGEFSLAELRVLIKQAEEGPNEYQH